jgi:Zn-dependent alcohol dehydrogenase
LLTSNLSKGDKFIWGLVKQAYQCRDCGLNAHKKCVALVASNCRGVKVDGYISNGHFESAARQKKSASLSSKFDDSDEETEEMISSVQGNFTKQNMRENS